MKRLILIPLILLIASALFAQSLQDNPDYRESLRYKQLSEQALEEGEYAQAREYAELSVEYAKKSDAYIERRLAQYRANQLLQRAESLRGQVERSGRNSRNPAVFGEASGLIEAARELYRGESYTESSDSSKAAIAMLEETFGGAQIATGAKLPAAYLVRKIPGAEDCFWRIAGYDFIYDDPAGWRPIYEANRDKLPQPSNPDLILPGMVLTIPAREGESRSGVWVDGEIRASAP